MSSIRVILSFFAVISLAWVKSAQAEISLNYLQSQNFWGILGKIENGVNDIASANDLLNQTYNQPVGAEISLLYRPDKIGGDSIQLREVRVDQFGYAVSSNPVLPQLFGWEGQGLTATVGYQFLEVYGGHFFGKRADAVSTDLIDRKLVSTDDVTLVGGGFHFEIPMDEPIPMKLEVLTRSTDFISTAVGSAVYNRWQVKLDVPTDFITYFLILGQNPIPEFDRNGLIWDYLWQTDNFPDFLSLLGVGFKTASFTDFNLNATAGFYGGYFGGKISAKPLSKLTLSLDTYGFETTSSFQARQLRLYGAELSYAL